MQKGRDLTARLHTRLAASLPLLCMVAACSGEPTAKSGPPASLAKVAGDSQAVVAGASVPLAPSVVVKDAQDRLLSGVTVGFRVTQGGGAVAAASATTSGAGTAGPGSWTLGAQSGWNTLAVDVTGLPSIQFSALAAAPAATLTAPRGETFAGQPSVEMQLPAKALNASSQAVQGAVVSLQRTGGTGTLAAQYEIADASGTATARFTPGATPGQSSISATLVGATGSGTTLLFTVNTYSGLTLAAVGSTTLSVNAGSSNDIVVRVRDGSSQNVANAPVTFSVASGNGQVSGGSSYYVKTDANGEARTTWTLPSASATYTARAEAFGQTVTFTATASDPPHLSAYCCSNQYTAAGDFPPFKLEARAQSGNANVSNVPITFSSVAGGAWLRTMAASGADYAWGQTLTLSSGVAFDAQVQLRTGPTAGTNRIAITSPGYAPDTFTVIGTRLADCAGIGTLNATDSIVPTLQTTDCPGFYNSGNYKWYTKAYRMTLSAPTQLFILMRMPSGSAGPALTVMNQDHYVAHNVGSTQIVIRLYAAAGDLYIGASTNTVAGTGQYTLTSKIINDVIRPLDFLMRGLDVNAHTDALKVETSPPYRGHGGKIFLVAGQPVTITMSSTDFDPYIAVRDVERTNSTSTNYAVLASDDNSGGGTTARLTFTPPHTGLFQIWLGAAKSTDGIGAYRLIIQ